MALETHPATQTRNYEVRALIFARPQDLQQVISRRTQTCRNQACSGFGTQSHHAYHQASQLAIRSDLPHEAVRPDGGDEGVRSLPLEELQGLLRQAGFSDVARPLSHDIREHSAHIRALIASDYLKMRRGTTRYDSARPL